jgi:phosphate acyltransferase
MKIGLDMMGGDYAPLESCNGVKKFLTSDYANSTDVSIYAIGISTEIEKIFEGNIPSKVKIIDAPEVIAMDDHPTKALREKQQSSIAIGFHLLAKGDIDAFISAGNTGVMLVGAAHIIKPIEGVLRPTIPTLVPKTNGGYSLLLDVGINADCKPEHLDQFAIIGSNYCEHVLNIKQPKVGLLNIGEEEGKGNLLAKASFELLKVNPHINFIGNIEGRDIFNGKADAIICDGYTGNIVLKLAESIYEIFHEQHQIKDAYLNEFNYENYGGTPVLGINKTVLVAHGRSNAEAFCQMLIQADKIAKSNMAESLKGKFPKIEEA